MDQVKAEETYLPYTPVPGVHASVYQQTSHNQYFFQGGTVKLLHEGTQNLPSIAMASTQPPQPLLGTLQYSGERLNYMQHYCIPTLPGGFSERGPVSFLPRQTQDFPSMAATTREGPQILPRPIETIWETSHGPQKNGTAGDLTACQLRNPSSSLPQGVVGATPHCSLKPVEEALQKRELRLMKNREAARECRRKKKEYVKCLENRVAVLENQNKTLIEELRSLKDVYRHKVEESARASRKRRIEYMLWLEKENEMLKAQLMSNLNTPKSGQDQAPKPLP